MAEFQSDFKDMFYSAHDISDCFYQFEIPPALSTFLGLKRVRAGDVGISAVHNVEVGPMAWVVPCLKVLPMGFSFAVHWAQNSHRELLRRGKVPGWDRVMVDFHRPSVDEL